MTTSFTMELHSTLTGEDTLVGVRTRDLWLVILTLYKLEQQFYVILPIFVYKYLCMLAYTAYSVYSAYNQWILYLFVMEKARPSLFIATIAWSPIPGPSCLRTTTYNHHHCSLICSRKLWESRLIPDAWQTVLFQSLQLEQEEGVPVWRTLESHTRLVLSHGARRLLQIDTDPARLRSTNNESEYV